MTCDESSAPRGAVLVQLDVLAVTHRVENQIGVTTGIYEQSADARKGASQINSPLKRSVGAKANQRDRNRVSTGL